ncbi:MAG: hypothetical protein ACJ76V_00150 [Thermoleophilaceae bacterium]
MGSTTKRDSWDSDPLWGDARERVRGEVQAAFKPKPQTCPQCGRTEETAARNCPHCGASYVFTQQRGLSRRARLALGASITLLVVGITGALIIFVPKIGDSKRENAARDRAAEAAFVKGETARLTRDQAPRRARSNAAAPSAVLADLERSITGDAKARRAAGTLRVPVKSVQCTRVATGPLATGPRGGYDCLAVTSYVRSNGDNQAGTLGYPFWAVVDFKNRTYTWCKVNRKPGERGVQSKEPIVPVAPACQIKPND